ncbi:F-box protein At2g17036-like [Asparagus officinalis]|uniref:F-box protein At2g17036-like n=1 Tax=Asparagus officinalis TaxID=4686 RepID=UPI00098DE85A|nr:F-box protein At2g17036-like [Asparagus officinalis]
MHLLNPVTGVQIQLPSITTLPYVCDYAEVDRPLFLYKAILSLPPLADGSGDFTVILLHNPFRLYDEDYDGFSNMAIAKVGDNSWTSLPRASHGSIADIIPHKGQLYGVDVGGVLHVWDHHHLTSGPKSTLEIRFYCGMTKLLVESLNGKLYMLYKGLYYDAFMAIRLDADNPEFNPEDDLGDNVFFVGSNTSFSVSATKFPELGGNCIYFTDDKNFDFDHLKHKPREMGVFDVKNWSMKPIPNLGQHLHWPPPIWIIPTLF